MYYDYYNKLILIDYKKRSLFILIKITIKECGQIVRLMDSEFISIKMVQNIKEVGRTIFIMEKEYKHGIKALSIKDNIFKVRNMEKENIIGMMETFIKDNGKKIIFKELFFKKGTFHWSDDKKYFG